VPKVVESKLGQPRPAECPPQDMAQEYVGIDWLTLTLIIGFAGKTKPRAATGQASFQRFRSGIRYAGI
jgi:hypothetical protein